MLILTTPVTNWSGIRAPVSLFFFNSAPLIWFSKRQPTVETSVFGAEFVAMKNGMETVRGLRYKLCMMGIRVDGPAYVYGDNMSVIHKTHSILSPC
jgi:hypothetical protein